MALPEDEIGREGRREGGREGRREEGTKGWKEREGQTGRVGKGMG